MHHAVVRRRPFPRTAIVLFLASLLPTLAAAAEPDITRAVYANTQPLTLWGGFGAAESSLAVVPPGVDNLNCPNGRIFFTSGLGDVQYLDLGVPATVTVGNKITRVRFSSLLPAMTPAGGLPWRKQADGTCQPDPTKPLSVWQQSGSDTQVLRVAGKAASVLLSFTGYRVGAVAAGSPPLGQHPDPNRRTTAAEDVNDPDLDGTADPYCAWVVNNVNYTVKSDDCGNNWQPANVVVNRGPNDPANTAQYNQGCGNFDQTVWWREPFGDKKNLWTLAGSGDKCEGGVSYSRVALSLNSGKSLIDLYQLPKRIYTTAISSSPAGTIVFFGCLDGRPVMYRGATSISSALTEVDLDALPACKTMHPSYTPDRIFAWTPESAAVSWGGTSPDGLRDTFRVAYPVVIPGNNLARQGFQLATVAVPTPGSTLGALIDVGERIEPTDPGDATIFRLGMVEPDGTLAAGKPRSTLLWWLEGAWNDDLKTGSWTSSYSLLTGRSTRSRTLPLSLANGTRRWFSGVLNAFTDQVGDPKVNGRWAGEYERGAFFQPANDAPSFLVQWPEADVPQVAVPHFNVVRAELPAATAFAKVPGATGVYSSPALVSTWVKNVTAFVRANDGSVRSIERNNSVWASGWRNWNGTIVGSPAVASWGTGRADVFGIGKNGHMWHLAIQNGVKVADWYDLGGDTFTFSPGAVSTGSGKVTVLGVRSSDRAVLAKTWDRGWGPWRRLGTGVATGGVGAASWGSGRLDVFVRGQNGRLWHYAEQNGAVQIGNGGWEDLGGRLTVEGTPGVIARGTGGLEVVVTRAEADWTSVDRLRYAANHWGDWHNLGGAATSSPGLVRPSPLVHSVIVVRGLDGGLWTASVP